MTMHPPVPWRASSGLYNGYDDSFDLSDVLDPRHEARECVSRLSQYDRLGYRALTQCRQAGEVGLNAKDARST
jgi:hypothetical protein